MKINPAKLIIDDYLELKALVENSENWKEEKLKDNPPRYFRLLRLNACLKALGIKFESWKEFEKGYFKADHSSKIDRVRLFKLMSSLTKNGTSQFTILADEMEIDSNYYMYMALAMRRNIYQFNALQNTVLTASENYVVPLLVTDAILDDLNKYSKTLDELLIQTLNPMNVSFSIREMIEKFDFPEVDLEKIDLDWI
jgi:hypothetical protein